MNFDVVIIGGGVAGVCTAINAKTDNNSVLVIEHNDRLLKKVLSTGNGRCNITNSFCTVSGLDDNPEGLFPYYSDGDEGFIRDVISTKDYKSTVDFFNSIGVLLENKNGYIYPRNEQASTIRDALINECEKKKIDVRLLYRAEKIDFEQQDEYRFTINNEIRCRHLVLAAGGLAAPKLGADGRVLGIAGQMGLHVTAVRPALCGVKCSDAYAKDLAGIRNDGLVMVLDETGKEYARSKGNIQFTSYGISGIPVFQVSHVIGKGLQDKKKVTICIDMLPEINRDEVAHLLEAGYPNSVKYLVNSKFAAVVVREAEKNPKPIIKASELIKSFMMHVTGLNSWDDAQVMAGGIATKDIDSSCMEVKGRKNLFAVGEILDVDGICGGYNLQWAISTGIICGESIKTEYKN